MSDCPVKRKAWNEAWAERNPGRRAEGMTWDNYGEWHIDHIVPLASASTPEETLELCHFSNLQPLWARDNLTKHAKVA